MEEKEIGVVTHFFGQISVAAIKITDGTLTVGDTIKIKTSAAEVVQKVDSMQVEHKSVPTAKKGEEVGIKVVGKVKENDKVFKAS
jgi:putative protease